MSYSLLLLIVIEEIDTAMKGFSHTKEKTGYGYKRRFANNMRFDIYEYKGKMLLRVSRGARLVRKYPLLYNGFDDVMKVIAKTQIKNTQQLHDKHILGIFKLLDDAPSGIGAFD